MRVWLAGAKLDSALAAAADEVPATDTLEVSITFDYRKVEGRSLSRLLSDRERGIRGLIVKHGARSQRWAPSRMIAANRSFHRVLEKFCTAAAITPEELLDGAGWVASFAARTVLIPLGSTPSVEICRGGRFVAARVLHPPVVEMTAREMATWMVRNTAPDGRIPYEYWPSTGEYSKANNPIRQLMATVCLGRIARLWPDLGAADASRRNLARNLEDFYGERGALGIIEWNGAAKLGASALAALAILEGEGLRGSHAAELGALARGIEALWEEGGAFRTFHYPKTRNDNQNFYPGEALVFWAALWLETRDPTLLCRFMASFRYYRRWHEENRNPAFIPWHTQAYASIYRETREPELLSWLFEMNDWLLPIQQGPECGYPDLVGRFYDPTRPFGPPHASSTGVYLEGLADAYDLARAVGDEGRANAYADAIRAGTRNLRQLQFKDEADMFYVEHRERVAGAVRTNAYDNTVRVDNVQHGLMALMKLITARHHERLFAAAP